MTDRLYVDIAALTAGGADLDRWSRLAKEIAGRMRTSTTTYRYAGGTGEMGEQFTTNYLPGEAKALQFLAMLEDVVGGYSDKTLLAARNFEQANAEADSTAPPE